MNIVSTYRYNKSKPLHKREVSMVTPVQQKHHTFYEYHAECQSQMSVVSLLPPPSLVHVVRKANSSHCFRAELKPLAWVNLLSASKLDNKRTDPSGPSCRQRVGSRLQTAESRQQSVTPTNHAQYIATTRKKQNEPPKWQKMTRILQPVNYGRSGTTD